MEIKRGEFYRCTEVNSVANLIAGKVYKSEEDGFITGEEGQQYNAVLSKFDRLYSIYDLANGHCAVINDGTRGELEDVLIEAFQAGLAGLPCVHKFYYKSNGAFWASFNSTELPTQSVNDFVIQIIEVETPDLSLISLMNAEPHNHVRWEEPKTRIRKQEIADHLGIPVEQLEIVE